MYNLSSVSIITKAGLLIGVMLAVFLLSSRLYDSAHARTTTTETINYEEGLTSPVTAYTALDPEGDTIAWSLSGTDAEAFEITGGALTFKNTPDYENPPADNTDNRYEVTIEATDSGTHPVSPSQVVIVKVINVDEDGVVSLTARQPLEGFELTAALTDPDNVTGSAAWQWARSTNKRTWTDIKDAELAIYEPVADDVDNYLRATASYDDGHGSKKTADKVSDNPVQADTRNKAPVFNDAEGEEILDGTEISRSIAENSAPDSPVGEPVEASDAHGGLTYTLGGNDASSFTIDSGTGQIKVGASATLDFEDPANTDHEYQVQVTATDPARLTDVITVSVTVTDVDEMPMITGGESAINHPENTDADTAVSTYTATDPEDDRAGTSQYLKWSLSGADSRKFSITPRGANSTLKFIASPDFEDPTDAGRNNVYDVTLEVTDSGGNAVKQAVTVKVTNTDEDGMVTLSSEQPEVDIRLTASLADPDGASGSTPPLDTNEMRITGVTWEWEVADPSGGACSDISSGDWAPITSADAKSATYMPGSADLGNCLRATATYTDAAASDEKFRATVSSHPVQADDPGNEPPVFPDQDLETDRVQNTQTERTVREDASVGTFLGLPVVADDPDDLNLTYALSSGRDAASIAIDRGTGQLSTKVLLDHETKPSYTVTVTATDPSLESKSIRVVIKVTNFDESPTITRGDTFIDYMENGTGTVSTYAATDPEKASIVWSLDDGDGSLFSITGGALKFKSPPNYENAEDSGGNNVYDVTVGAGDGGTTEVDTEVVTIRVINVDEDGEVELSATQPQEGVPLMATLSDEDGAEANTIRWQWARSSSSRGTYTNIKKDSTSSPYTPVADDVGKYLRATASYDDGHGDKKTAHRVSTNSVQADTSNKDPVFENDDGQEITTISREVVENLAEREPVGDPVAAMDAGGGLTYTLSGTDESSFTIDSGTGQIRVGAGTTLNFETETSYTVTVTATDPFGRHDTITVNITVTDVDEAPSIDAATQNAGLAAISHQEDTPIVTTLSNYIATDPEGGEVVWSLTGHDADHFCIDENRALTFLASPDYENPTDAGRNNRYEVTVIASDSAGNEASRDVTVTVTNVNDDGKVALSSEQPQDGIDLTATLTDPDGASGSTPPLSANEMRITGVTWVWESSPPAGNDCLSASAWGTITRANAKAATYRPVSADVDNCLRATATYTDGHGADKNARTPSAHPVQARDPGNQPPGFPDQDLDTEKVQNDRTERSVREDAVSDPDGDSNSGNVGLPVIANDPEDNNLTYALSGVDAPSFDIARGTGQITVGDGTKLDYETKRTYTVTVTATDPSNESTSIIVTIKVTDFNERPELSKKALVVSGRTNIDHPENDTNTVATYTAAGPRAGNASWSLLETTPATSPYQAGPSDSGARRTTRVLRTGARTTYTT